MTKEKMTRRPKSKRPYGISFEGQTSRTKQSFKDEVDINKRIARYMRTGYLSDPLKVSQRQAFFADVTGAEDFQAMQNRVLAIRDKFMELPSELRLKFNNDPKYLLEYLSNPANMEEAIEIGLLKDTKATERHVQNGSDDVANAPKIDSAVSSAQDPNNPKGVEKDASTDAS